MFCILSMENCPNWFLPPANAVAKVMFSVMCICLSVHRGSHVVITREFVQTCSLGGHPPDPCPSPAVHMGSSPYRDPKGISLLFHYVARTVGKRALGIPLKYLLLISTFTGLTYWVTSCTESLVIAIVYVFNNKLLIAGYDQYFQRQVTPGRLNKDGKWGLCLLL